MIKLVRRVALCAALVLILVVASGCTAHKDVVDKASAKSHRSETTTTVPAKSRYSKSSSSYPPKVFMHAMDVLEDPDNYHMLGYEYNNRDKYYFDASNALLRMIREHKGDPSAAAVRYLNAVHGRTKSEGKSGKLYAEVVREIRSHNIKIPERYREYLDE